MRSDEALLEGWLRGELNAFDELYLRYEAPLFGFIRRMGPADAEDVLHHTFLGLMREARGRRIGHVRALLYEIARNTCLNHARSARRVEPVSVPNDPPSPELQLLAREQSAALSQALTKLPSTLSETWALRASGLSYEEMSRVLKVPLGTVKSRMNELLNRLREELR